MPSLWLVPPAFAAHVAEEAPGFTSWARRNTSKRYTQRDFVRNNAFGAILTVAATALAARSRDRRVGTAAASVFHALIVAEQVYRVDWRSLRR